MNSDIDLPHQLDTLRQSSLMKKKSNHIWKVIFILLLIVNFTFGHWVLWNTDYGRYIDAGFLGVIPLIFILAIIDFITIFSYITMKNPHSIDKFINYTALTVISLVLVYFGIATMNVLF